jgi:MFS family permease
MCVLPDIYTPRQDRSTLVNVVWESLSLVSHCQLYLWHSLTTSVGALLTGLAQNFGMFIAGRFLTGLGCTLAASSA